ncbi:DUF6090 family protein [Aquiflexum sp. TKW24L]|uniref:DUF6090 family protein n=1 Tax=Aquiflexum sp. TKW24L TaxID=2942212 RepID=UPI0020BEE0B6|nr:DUF6090 family protein [Aquiflexum sp. TKW24L]MCL6257665.1 DUF6090 family protein [Aquiflexum sp. TKW24L]
MISLFRKIRQKLLEENKAGNYLKYAIGEIFLVVIGILIALQVNNWNEQRKDKIKSYSYLVRLNEDIDLILADVDNSLKGAERKLISSIMVQKALEAKDLPKSEKEHFDRYLNEYHQFYVTIQDSRTYIEMISASGINLIENQWIRNAFSSLADYREFIIDVNRANRDAQMQNSQVFEAYVRYRFENALTDSAVSIPYYDFEAMATDEKFINRISKQSRSWNVILNMFKGYNSQVLQIRDSVQSELKKFHSKGFQ